MNTTQILTTAIFFVAYFVYTLTLGSGLLLLLKVEPSKALAIPTGTVALFALGEIIAMPFMQTQGDYHTFFVLFTSVCAFLFAASGIYVFVVHKRYRLLTVDFKDFGNASAFLLFFLIFLQTAAPVCFSRFDGDDALYIAISTSIQTTGRIFLNNPSIGLDEFVFPPNYKFTAYEVVITVLCDLVGFEPVVVYHTLLPLVFIPTYYLVNYAFGEALFPKPEEKDRRMMFILLIALLTIFDAYSNYLASSFELLKSWMGKSSTINFCYTLFLTYFVYAYRSQNEKENRTRFFSPNCGYFFLITVCLLGSAGTSSVGLYIVPVAYFTLFVASLFTLRYRRKDEWIRSRLSFTFKAALSALPSAALLVGFYLMLKSTPALGQLMGFESYRSWITDASLLFYYNAACASIYGISAVYFAFFGGRLESTVFFWGVVVLLLTFLNPLLHDVVGRNLTSLPLYWRFFWLLDVFPTIAAFVTQAYYRLRKENGRRIALIVFVPLLFIIMPVNFALTNNKYFASENAGKIPDDIAPTVRTIKQRVTTDNPNDLYLLALPKYNIYIRQYTGDIALVMPRLNYVREAYQLAGKSAEFVLIDRLFTFDDEHIITGLTGKFNLRHLRILGVSLIITPNEHPELKKDFAETRLDNKDYLYIKTDIYKGDDDSS